MAGKRLPLSWLIGATAVALVAAGAVVLLLDDDADSNGDGGERTGEMELTPAQAVPDSVGEIVLGSLDGEPDQKLADVSTGRPLVINFFGSWCQPCLEEMPAFEKVHAALGEQVDFIGLAENDTAARAKDTVERTGVTYPTFADPAGSALTFFSATLMPTTVFVGADGEIKDVHGGELSETELRAALAEHLGVGGG